MVPYTTNTFRRVCEFLSKKKRIQERYKRILNMLLVLKKLLYQGDFQDIIRNLIDLITSPSKTETLSERIEIADITVYELFKKELWIHEVYLFERLKKNPESWKEILVEFKRNKLNLDYKNFFSILEGRGYTDVLESNLRFLEEEVFSDINISGISKLSPLLRKFYALYCLKKENYEAFKKKFDDWNKFLVLVKYQTGENREDIFRKYWDALTDKEKNEFIKRVTRTQTMRDSISGMAYHTDVLPSMEEFSEEFKRDIVQYFDFGYSSIFGIDPHIYWIPKIERYEYLKRMTPINNVLCYALFNIHDGFGLLSILGTEKEIVNYSEIEKLIEFYIKKYGRDACYVDEAVDRFEEWKEKNLK